MSLARVLFWETVGGVISAALFARRSADVRAAYRDLMTDVSEITTRLAQVLGSDTLDDGAARRARVMLMGYAAEQVADHYRSTGTRPAKDLIDHIHMTATMVMDFETPAVDEFDVDTILRRRIASTTAMQPIVTALSAHAITGAEPTGIFTRLQGDADDILREMPGATARDRDAVLLGLSKLYASSYCSVAADGMLNGPAALQEIDRLFAERVEFIRAAAMPLNHPTDSPSPEMS